MAGIYIHIPFCKQACHYCNFHFSTSLKNKERMLKAILKELDMQKEFLNKTPISSIYLGGGTPSLLNKEELQQLFNKIYQLHQVKQDAEITLEANPDDLSPSKLEALYQTPINRLSIGIQSFSEEDLKFMNRAHNAQEAKNCIRYAQEAGFQNLTIDLIYATPTMSDETWKENIEQAIQFKVPHISCYSLTVEPNTALHHFVKVGKAPPIDEEKAAQQFEYLMETLENNGYLHYEISNFAKPNYFAQHNSSYWQDHLYLGVGPAAHSYNKEKRQWNIANNMKYVHAIENHKIPSEMEMLTPEQRYNEYVMTGLRTIWGCNLNNMPAKFKTFFLKKIQSFIIKDLVMQDDQTYKLTKKGRLLADNIAVELFWEQDQ